MNKFIWNEKDVKLPDYSSDNVFNLFVNNFLELSLCKINILDVFIMFDFFSDFYYIATYWNSDGIKLLVGNVSATNP